MANQRRCDKLFAAVILRVGIGGRFRPFSREGCLQLGGISKLLFSAGTTVSAEGLYTCSLLIVQSCPYGDL